MQPLHDGGVSADLGGAASAVQAYLDSTVGGLTRLSDADVLSELRELEVLRRRLAVVDHALIGELDRRGLAGQLVMATTSAVLQGLLRLSPREAKDRVEAARACGPRHTLTGQPQPALRPVLAAAQSDGLSRPSTPRPFSPPCATCRARPALKTMRWPRSISSKRRPPCGRER